MFPVPLPLMGPVGTGKSSYLGVVQATTSGTTKDFPVPADALQIDVIFDKVSVSGTDAFVVQIGTGGTPTVTGYVSSSTAIIAANSFLATSTAGFIIRAGTAASSFSGRLTITRADTNDYVSDHTGHQADGAALTGGGDITLAGAMDIVRITTSGVDTFDAGQVNILVKR